MDWEVYLVNNSFEPGKILKNFTSNREREVLLRFIQSSDTEAMTEYINTLSKEDTYVMRSGEILTLDEEKEYVTKLLEKMKDGDGFMIGAFLNGKLIGEGNIDRLGFRSKHVGSLGISIKKEFRGEGIGKELMEELLVQAHKMELQYIELIVYEPNDIARHLYTEMGFEEVGRVPKKAQFHGEYIDEIIMYKAL